MNISTVTTKGQATIPEEIRRLLDINVGDRIIFSESYDASWIAQSLKFKVQSLKFNNRFNSFTLKDSGDYSLIVYYYPQILVNIGMVISGLTLVLILGALIYFKKRKI